MKVFELDGNNFNDMDSFYDEVNSKLCPQFEGFGSNLDAFNDVLRGGFLAFEYNENIELNWKQSDKSKADLAEQFKELIDIIRDHKHIKLTLL